MASAGYNLRRILEESDYTLMDLLKGRCATCKKYTMDYYWVNGGREAGRCSIYGDVRFDDTCNYYDDNYYLSVYKLREGLDNIKRKHGYVVSAICDILGLPEDCEYRELYNLVEKDLENTKDGEQLLADYEKYGREIACLFTDISKHSTICNEIVKSFANIHIIPEFDKMVADIHNNRRNRALLRYIVLIRNLMDSLEMKYIPMESRTNKENENYSPYHNNLLAYKMSK